MDGSQNSFKQQLDSREAQLRNEISAELMRADDERYIDLAGLVHDNAEASVADLLADLSIAAIDRQVSEIREIEAAYLRMANGTYGVCIECGSDIAPQRLRIAPAAARCVDCQGRYEQTHAGAHHPTL